MIELINDWKKDPVPPARQGRAVPKPVSPKAIRDKLATFQPSILNVYCFEDVEYPWIQVVFDDVITPEVALDVGEALADVVGHEFVYFNSLRPKAVYFVLNLPASNPDLKASRYGTLLARSRQPGLGLPRRRPSMPPLPGHIRPLASDPPRANKVLLVVLSLQRFTTRRAAAFSARPAGVPLIRRHSAVEASRVVSRASLPCTTITGLSKAVWSLTTYLSGSAHNASRYLSASSVLFVSMNLLPPIATGTRSRSRAQIARCTLADTGPCLVEVVVEDAIPPGHSDASASARSLAVMSAV